MKEEVRQFMTLFSKLVISPTARNVLFSILFVSDGVVVDVLKWPIATVFQKEREILQNIITIIVIIVVR